jgi:hypothetical protein
MNEKLIEMVEKVKVKKAKEQVIKDKFKALDKKKKLTTDQRLDRIEELLGVED